MLSITETYRIKDVLDAAGNRLDIETIESALRIREAEIDRFFDGEDDGLSLDGLKEESRRLYDAAIALYGSGQSLKKRARILLAISKMLTGSALMPAPAHRIADYINKVEEIVREWESSRNRDVATTSAIFQNLIIYCTLLGNDAAPRWQQLIRQEATAAQNEATPIPSATASSKLTNVSQSASQQNYSWEGMATSIALHRLSFLTAYTNNFPGKTDRDILNRLITHYADTILNTPPPKPRQLVQLSDIIAASGYAPTQTATKLHAKISSQLSVQTMPSIRFALESCLPRIDKEVNGIDLNTLKYLNVQNQGLTVSHHN